MIKFWWRPKLMLGLSLYGGPMEYSRYYGVSFSLATPFCWIDLDWKWKNDPKKAHI